jgi:hypothetical protein
MSSFGLIDARTSDSEKEQPVLLLFIEKSFLI